MTKATERLLNDVLEKFVSAQVSIARLVHHGNKIWKNKGEDNTMPTTFELRQEIGLQSEKASILSKQSQVLGRQIHNLEVAQTATTSELPASEEITEAAAAAETALEALDETYEAVRTVSSAASDQAMTEEEAAILAEFEAEAAKQAEAKTETPAKTPETEETERGEPDRAPEGRRREADG